MEPKKKGHVRTQLLVARLSWINDVRSNHDVKVTQPSIICGKIFLDKITNLKLFFKILRTLHSV